MSESDADLFPDGPDTWACNDPRWEGYYANRIPYTGPIPSKNNTEPLPESFGRNLDTLEKARLWLTNPHNWHTSKLFILKWNGLLCTVDEEHGQSLVREPWNNGLPWCAVYGQQRRRARGERGEAMEDIDNTLGWPPDGPSENSESASPSDP